MKELKQLDLFAQPTVADFFLEKDPLFARLTLDDQEFTLYQQIYQHVRPQAPAPDLVIYLQAPASVLYERVRQRGIPYEGEITESYLARLADTYSSFFHHYDASPLLIVNNAGLDTAGKPEDLDLLVERIRSMRGGREFFNRGG